MGICQMYRELEERVATTRRADIVEIFANESRPPFTVCEDLRNVCYGEPEWWPRDDYDGVVQEE